MPMSKRARILGLTLAVTACGDPDVPEHEVRVTSDCSGDVKWALFHFAAIDFETSCSGGLFESTCSTNVGHGERRSGTLTVHDFTLEGLETSGPSRYVLELPRSEAASDDDFRPFIWCGWYVDASLHPTEGKRQDCYYSAEACWAEIEVLPG